MEPLLELSGIRVDPELDGLSLQSTGTWVLVLGAPRKLFDAACGQEPLARGTALVAGRTPVEALRSGVACACPRDPPLPLGWTVTEYVTWSARLAGLSSRRARAMVADALERLQLARFADSPLRSLPLAARRGTCLAAALAVGADAVLLEDPVTGLPDEVSRPFTRVVARALADSRVALFAPRIALESPLALAADEAIVIDGSAVAAQGAPAEVAATLTTVSLRVSGDARRFEQALKDRGARPLSAAISPGAGRISVDVGTLTRTDLFQIATACDVALLEVRLIARTFA